MMTSTVFIAEDFAATFSTAKDFTSVEDAAEVLVIMIMLSTIWIPGLLGVIVDTLWKREKKKITPGSIAPSEGKKVILQYLHKVIPEVFTDNAKGVLLRLASEVARHHSILKVFSTQSKSERREVIGKAMTLLTYMLFLTAVFFDVSNPGDDGSCAGYTTEEDCLRRISPFDNALTYCTWSANAEGLELSGEESQCRFNTTETSIKALYYLTVLTTVLTAIATIPLDYLFGIISAPAANSLKGSKIMKTINAVAAGARRMSALGGITVAAVAPGPVPNTTNAAVPAAADVSANSFMNGGASASVATTSSTKFNFKRKQSKQGGEDAVLVSREVPEEIEAAGEAARSSASRHLKDNATRLALQKAMSLRAMRERSARHSVSSFVNNSAPLKADQVRGGGNTASTGATDVPAQSASGAEELLSDVLQQRRWMNDGADETLVYDAQWGICKRAVADNQPLYDMLDSVRAAITADVEFAEAEALTLTETLSNYPVSHAGLEILHLFMVDLLGRNTPAARIFQEKFGEEFGSSQVVVMWQKYLALLTLVLLNAFFAYYVMLKAFEKGIQWQYEFLLCCVIQLAVEVFIFETTECMWLNFAVPTLVKKEVLVAVQKLMKHVEGLALTNEQGFKVNELSAGDHFSIDAPTHLFASVKIARAYPNLLESMIVGSYSDHLPGEIWRTWPHFSERGSPQHTTEAVPVHTSRYVVPRSILRGINLAIQAFIAIPYLYQRVLIRCIQPVVLSGISIVWFTAIQSIISLAVVGSLCGAIVLYVVWRHVAHRRSVLDAQRRVGVDPSFEDSSALVLEIRPIPTFIPFEDQRSETSSDLGLCRSFPSSRGASEDGQLGEDAAVVPTESATEAALLCKASRELSSSPTSVSPLAPPAVTSRPVHNDVSASKQDQGKHAPPLTRKASWAGSEFSADTDEIERMMDGSGSGSDLDASDCGSRNNLQSFGSGAHHAGTVVPKNTVNDCAEKTRIRTKSLESKDSSSSSIVFSDESSS